ncbi:TBC domain-containing protein [Xylariales sp. AK1849]|nr:TBC domain-containing protein [Xylariales sp. AK1849]
MILADGDPCYNLQAAASDRGPKPSVRRERSRKFREFGLYASKSSPFSSPTDDAVYSPQYDLAPQIPPQPLSPISPRWDSLAHSTTVIYDHTHSSPSPSVYANTAASSPGRSIPIDWCYGHSVDSLDLELRDAFSLRSRTTEMNAIESRHASGASGESLLVENFSRPRRPSIKQPSPDSVRYRPANASASHSDPKHLEASGVSPYLLWPRERNHSISSNQSTSTFNSLPVRPSPDLQSRDSVRGRSRQGIPAWTRPPMAYSRGESSGPSFARDPIPRMASMPSDELRSSFRSQLSASTAPGTMQTERSSVMTKSSSVTSIYGPVDDGFSVDDVMGMYEKGFRDDSPAPTDYYEDASRPPTGRSELSRRRTLMLEAMSDSLPRHFAKTNTDADANSGIDKGRPVDARSSSVSNVALVRDSAAIFRSGELPSSLHKNMDYGTKHDSGKHVDDDDVDDFPLRSPKPQTQEADPVDVEDIDTTRDRYGFRKQNQYVTQDQYDSWNEGHIQYLERRRKKWNAFLKESGLMTDHPNRFPQRSAKTKRFVRKGFPPEWRGAAWFYYAGGPAILAKHGGVYDELLGQTAKDVDNEAIERDLHRTFPDNLKFRSAETSSSPNTETGETRDSQSTVTEATGNAARPNETRMISSLRRVLHAFSIYNPRIGYCQSLNFLAGLLLLFVETEEHAFWLLNIITRVYLPGTHEMSLEGANVDLGVLMSALREAMPAVWTKIGGELDGSDAAKPKSRRFRKGAVESTRLPPITLCMTAWFMSCFIGTLPIETTLRVWDVFFYEGSKTLFRIALAVFKLGETEIKNVSDPMEIFQVVQTIPRRLIDANALMEACFKRRNGFGHLSQETIEQRRQERRDDVKLEQERAVTGLADEATDFKRKGTLFAKNRRPAEVM